MIPFLSDIKIGDYVVMPGPGSVVNHYGRVESDPFHDQRGTHNNRREIEWSGETIPQHATGSFGLSTHSDSSKGKMFRTGF